MQFRRLISSFGGWGLYYYWFAAYCRFLLTTSAAEATAVEFEGEGLGVAWKISERSWHEYMEFAKETCRLEDEDYAATHKTDPYYGYWSWESNRFLHALRSELLPGTRSGDYRSYAASDIRDVYDNNLFASELPSLCKPENESEVRLSDEEWRVKEQNEFEDYLINKIIIS